MQAIQTKDLGPRSTHGAKIRVKCAAKSISVPYDHELAHEANHRAAAQVLAVQLDWTGPNYGRLECGQLHDGSYVHVFVEGSK